MPEGFATYKIDGTPLLDITGNLVKFLGTQAIGNSYTGSAASGSFTDARLTAYTGMQPFVLNLTGYIDTDGYFPVFSFSGNNLNWSFPRNVPASTFSRPDTIFVYGFL